MPLVPKLLVNNALVVDDPLFAFVEPTNEHSNVERQGFGMQRDDEIDLPRLHNKLLYFSALAPLVEAGFIHVLPLSLLHRAPDVIPLNSPKNLYRERVPAGAVDFVFDSVIVNPMQRTENGIIILDEPNDRRARQMCITFRNDDSVSHASYYFYREPEFRGKNPDGSLILSYKPWNDDPLDEAQYAIWQEQAINQTVGERINAVAKEISLAESLGTPYMTESSFEAELLARSGGQISQDSNVWAVNFLEANAGLLNLTDPALVFRLRTEDPELFERFRLSLRAAGDELQGVPFGEFAARSQQYFEREIRPQVEEINAAATKVMEASAKGLLQIGGGLSLALLTGPTIPVFSLLGLAANGIIGEAIPAVGDYVRSRKRPEFIWNRLMG
jgi:hypothetical protein